MWPTSLRNLSELASGNVFNEYFQKQFNGNEEDFQRAKEGYEEQLGRDNEKALDAAFFLITSTEITRDERIEKLRDLLKRCERALGEKNAVTFETLNLLGIKMDESGEYEEAIEYYERALKGSERTLRKNHPSMLTSVMNIAVVYKIQKDYGKAEELYQRALEGYEAQLGKDHKSTMRCPENYLNCLNVGGNSARLAELRKAHPNAHNYDV
ncbi:hypothetical protein TL16_g02470 [Triparma laevis f. inornata]|uniref:Kinesin light chain n=1 Tax=Triparma laevis f. inornata TaxID=1714386 RepID=A0A9W7DWU8_9STRA|nr:hypothetical protein TL16_g02470 [Triparma laevis f. inornata]